MQATTSSQTETMKDIFNRFMYKAAELLTQNTVTKKLYTSLDPLLKFNFDQVLESAALSLIQKLLENLYFYSYLSAGPQIQLVGPKKFLVQTKNARDKLVSSINSVIDESFIVKEIKETLGILRDNSIIKNSENIKKKFKNSYKQISKKLNEEKEGKIYELLKTRFKLRINIEELIDKKL